jgi:A/G-specific adenine glycosylase
MGSEAKHLSKKEAALFRRRLVDWYQRHGRDLPWRRTRDPYAIFISEVMLQQTQVATVIPFYKNWLKRFSNVERLACASEADALHAWQGLGYYSRALNIHRTAKILRKNHRGEFPAEIESLAALPGIGRYTANAIATFAFDRSVPIVETNIARLLARLFNLRVPIDSTEGRLAVWRVAESLLPKCRGHNHNSALMDLGAIICTARAPRCRVCPVKKFCRAPDPENLPLEKPRPAIKEIEENHAFMTRSNEVALQQANHRWRGMWMLPPFKDDPSKSSRSDARPIHVSVFPFTHHRVTLRVFRTPPRRNLDATQRWFPISKLAAIPIPTPHRRALSDLLAAA